MRPSFGRFEFFASSIISLREQKKKSKRSEQLEEKEQKYLPNLWIQLLQCFIKLIHGVISVGFFVVNHVQIASHGILSAFERLGCNNNF
jgi:hypothetical protein